MQSRWPILSILLVVCSCRLVIDPDEFQDQGDGGVAPIFDAAVFDDADLAVCQNWEPRFIAIDITEPPILGTVSLGDGPYRIVNDGGDYQLVDNRGMVNIPLELTTQRDGSAVLLLRADRFIVSAGEVLTVQSLPGTPPLLVAARSGIEIAGTIDVSSDRGGDSGLGADPDECNNGHKGGPGSDPFDAGGGGGGGGGFGARGGLGGEAYGSTAADGEQLELPEDAFHGGCPGGRGAAGMMEVAAPGAGGGAIHLLTCGRIDIRGTVDASGAGGEGGSHGAGGGGAGSGGFIGLEAFDIQLLSGTTLAANGGAGGGGSDLATTDQAAGGQDGTAGDDQASGGTGSAMGGNGGAGDPGRGSSGAAAPSNRYGSGGGGGGVGRILFRYRGSVYMNGQLVVSPNADDETF